MAGAGAILVLAGARAILALAAPSVNKLINYCNFRFGSGANKLNVAKNCRLFLALGPTSCVFGISNGRNILYIVPSFFRKKVHMVN